MFTENALALLSLVAVSIAGGTGAGAFAAGVGKLLGLVTFGAIQPAYGTALGFGVFVVIVLTMVQPVFRIMRVTLGEWLGDVWLGLPFSNNGASGWFPRPARQPICGGRAGDQPHRSMA